MKVNSGLMTLLESCNVWEYRKSMSFTPKCESVLIEDLSMTKCYQTYKAKPIPKFGHVSDNLLAIFGQKIKKSVLEMCELCNTYLLIAYDYFSSVRKLFEEKRTNLWFMVAWDESGGFPLWWISLAGSCPDV